MITRYFGLDVHKNYVVAEAVDRGQQTLVPKERIPMGRSGERVEQDLTRLDEVALEVTTNAWPVVDLGRAQAGRVVVVNPNKTKLIAEARIKNDKADAEALAKLLAEFLLAARARWASWASSAQPARTVRKAVGRSRSQSLPLGEPGSQDPALDADHGHWLLLRLRHIGFHQQH